ncbi:MAG: YedE family putative selenium transporter [Chloroflexota bacterium]|nr:YedE family putative selenium transporter [Chloroflexota bacterium]
MRVSRIMTPGMLIFASALAMGILAALLVKWGNPQNMGICVGCFLRDISGAMGLHQASAVQYLRPEILGFVLGSFGAAYAFKEFRARGGSNPLARFFLGMFVMIGILVFLGCPVRALLRLAGGDLNAITGLVGVAFGALIGVFLLKRGFTLGRSVKMPTASGWIMPVVMIGLLIMAIVKPSFLNISESGPGSQFAPIITALAVGLFVGVAAQRTRMCFVGGWRDLFLVRDTYLFKAIVGLFLGALLVNLILTYGFSDSLFKLSFVDQPASHDNHLWNFFGMTLVGLGATQLGGCPLRQLVLSGEGDTDAAMTVLGLLVGAGVAHNFTLASSGNGPSALGPWAVVAGLITCIAFGFLFREKIKA